MNDHVRVIPGALAHLPRLAAKGDGHGRYALGSVSFEPTPGHGYKAMATDAKYGAVVEGRSVLDACAVDRPELVLAPAHDGPLLVDAQAWAAAMRGSPAAAVAHSPDGLTMLTASGLHRLGADDARFPPLEGVFPKGEPDACALVDGDRLAELLSVAARFAATDSGMVLLEIRRGKPVVVRTAGTHGLSFAAVLRHLD